MTAPPREPVAITEIDRVIERLQMDIDDGGRPDMWSMQSMQECLRKARAVLAAPAPSAEPPAQAATERMGTHWETCATDGGPRHYDCALRLIEQQAREIAELRLAVKDDAQWAQENERLTRERDEWKLKYGDANEWGLRHAAAWKERAERAEAERDETRKRIRVYDSGGFADADALAAHVITLTAERDALREVVRAADAMRDACELSYAPYAGSYERRRFDDYDVARAKVKP